MFTLNKCVRHQRSYNTGTVAKRLKEVNDYDKMSLISKVIEQYNSMIMNHMSILVGVKRIMGKEEGKVQVEKGRMGVLGESGGKRDRGNIRRRRMDVGSYFAYRGLGNRETGRWMREKGAFSWVLFRKFWISPRVSRVLVGEI